MDESPMDSGLAASEADTSIIPALPPGSSGTPLKEERDTATHATVPYRPCGVSDRLLIVFLT